MKSNGDGQQLYSEQHWRGTGFRHFRQTASSETELEIGEPRRIEVKGWVTEWLKTQITGLNDDKVKEVLKQLGDFITEDAKTCMDLAHSVCGPGIVAEENNGQFVVRNRHKQRADD